MYSQATGAAAIDSDGRAIVAMTDGKLFASADNAHTWWHFASPSMNTVSYISHLAAGPNGTLFAIDSNTKTGLTRPFIYDSIKGWREISAGLSREGFRGPAIITGVWCENGYAYAGTWNMGLFRSTRPLSVEEAVRAEHREQLLGVSPNPASHFLAVELPDAYGGALTLTDVGGRIRETFPISPGSSSATLPLDAFESGTYLLLFSNSSEIRSAKIRVMH
jgi:hypothetical protein